MIDRTLANYRLVSELGHGGMGVVYLAEHEVLHNRAALKILPEKFASSPTLIKRFEREGKSMLALKHSNIVEFMHFGIQENTYFIVMELIEGQSLRQLLDKKESLSIARALDIAIQCCDALSYAHGKGIIHRDIKPGNILISKEGNVKVSDFGLARIVGDEALSVGDLGTAIGEGSIGLIATKGSRLTRTGTSPGTVDYMSPEQREPGEETDQRTDIYSLGVVLYEMLTGRLPAGIPEMPSELNPEATEGLDRIVATALAPRKEKRYQEIGELKRGIEEELSRKQRGLESEKRKQEERERSRREEQRRRDEEKRKREERRRREEEKLRQVEERKKAEVVRAEKRGRRSKGHPLWKVIAGAASIIVIGIIGYFLLLSPAPEPGREVTKVSSKPPLKPSGEMVLVRAGSFMMGSNSGDSDEKPVHKVYVDSFHMDKCEETVGEYIRFLEATRKDNGVDWSDLDCPVKKTGGGYRLSGNRFGSDLNQPMVEVSWYGAVMYCNWRSKKEGLETCYDEKNWECDFSKSGYRLPTEAEWEYACRAETTTAYCFGNSRGGLGEYGWYGSNSGTRTHPVGEKKPNAWGLYDMHGNVWEWCNDRYDSSYYGKSSVNDPKGPDSGGSRVLRGGSWYDYASRCRSAIRRWLIPSLTFDYSGFRCVRSGAL